MNPGIVPPQLQVTLMNYYCFIFVPDVLSLLLSLLLLFLFLMFITSKGNVDICCYASNVYLQANSWTIWLRWTRH